MLIQCQLVIIISGMAESEQKIFSGTINIVDDEGSFEVDILSALVDQKNLSRLEKLKTDPPKSIPNNTVPAENYDYDLIECVLEIYAGINNLKHIKQSFSK